MEFGPILPHSSGDEQDVVIRNPCSFPVEFYNLEFDPQYLEEEKVGGWGGGGESGLRGAEREGVGGGGRWRKRCRKK